MATIKLEQKQRKRQEIRRIWKSPISNTRWIWLVFGLLLTGGVFAWYLYTLKTQQYPGPFNDPLRLFGIIAFVLVLGTAAYSLRRRFMRGLPGKVQSWLWMHTWIGITAILIALFHENFVYVTHEYCAKFSCLTDARLGGGALFALIFLVASGVVGRLVDRSQARIIAREAATNGVGIERALEERILELEYVVERLCAGKSEAFKQYCLQAIDDEVDLDPSQGQMANLPTQEQMDFQRVYDTLGQRRDLVQSLKRQQRARKVIRIWRTTHMILACLALLVIGYHAIMELLSNVLHVIPAE
jgi:cytochrome b561